MGQGGGLVDLAGCGDCVAAAGRSHGGADGAWAKRGWVSERSWLVWFLLGGMRL